MVAAHKLKSVGQYRSNRLATSACCHRVARMSGIGSLVQMRHRTAESPLSALCDVFIFEACLVIYESRA